MISVRLFAAASDAAGGESCELVAGDETSTVGKCHDVLAERFGGELKRVLERSTFLVNGERVEPGHLVNDGDTLDVLPPFAGG